MNIYVASSWRNTLQPSIVAALRDLGHQVYDFREPAPGDHGFSWSEVDPDWKITSGAGGYVSADKYKEMLRHPSAARGFTHDMRALKQCEAVVYVLPCGRSASWEFGYAMGAGKQGYVVWFDKHEPELMFRGATIIASMEELKMVFAQDCTHSTQHVRSNPTAHEVDFAVADAFAQGRRAAYQRAIEIVDEGVRRSGDRNDVIYALVALRDRTT